MKYTLKQFGNSNAYMMEVRVDGNAGLVKILCTKPTDRQVRRFIAGYKRFNKLRDRVKNGEKVVWR